jgi:hypothetical protein
MHELATIHLLVFRLRQYYVDDASDLCAIMIRSCSKGRFESLLRSQMIKHLRRLSPVDFAELYLVLLDFPLSPNFPATSSSREHCRCTRVHGGGNALFV